MNNEYNIMKQKIRFKLTDTGLNTKCGMNEM